MQVPPNHQSKPIRASGTRRRIDVTRGTATLGLAAVTAGLATVPAAASVTSPSVVRSTTSASATHMGTLTRDTKSIAPASSRLFEPHNCIAIESQERGIRLAASIEPAEGEDDDHAILALRVEKLPNSKWKNWNLSPQTTNRTIYTTTHRLPVFIQDNHKLFWNPNYIGVQPTGWKYPPIIRGVSTPLNTHDAALGFALKAKYAGRVKKESQRRVLDAGLAAVDFGFRSDRTKILKDNDDTWLNRLLAVGTIAEQVQGVKNDYREIGRGRSGLKGGRLTSSATCEGPVTVVSRGL